MILPAMFHWSPRERREAIQREGLVPYSDPTIHTGDEEGKKLAFPYLCLSPTPSAAWGLSGDMEWASEIEEWDLWQVRLQEGDEITIRGDFVPRISEVRVKNAIAAERVWYVATRKCPVAEPVRKAPHAAAITIGPVTRTERVLVPVLIEPRVLVPA